jgi:type I restriction enzyme S subunit
LDYSDVARFSVDARQLAQRQLQGGDIIIERSGGGPKQPVGRIAFFEPQGNEVFCTSNFTTALRVANRSAFEPSFVALYLLHLYNAGYTKGLQRATTGLRNLDWSSYLDFAVPKPPIQEQVLIAALLEDIRKAVLLESRHVIVSEGLKETTMQELFSHGTRGEAQKETEIGFMPKSWNPATLGSLGRIGNGSTPKRSVTAYWEGGYYPWLTSAKVYDRLIVKADELVTDEALNRCHLPRVSAGSLVIAITGQGKTLGNCALLGIEATVSQHLAYVALNTSKVVGSYVRGYVETQYRRLREVASGGGSTKGALTCAFLREMQVPLPPTREEQQEIADILDHVDQKIDLHKRKKAILEDLFKTLLNKLMTGEVRVNNLDLSALETAPETEVTV